MPLQTFAQAKAYAAAIAADAQNKSMPFVITADHKPVTVGEKKWRDTILPERQLELFGPEPSVFSGQL